MTEDTDLRMATGGDPMEEVEGYRHDGATALVAMLVVGMFAMLIGFSCGVVVGRVL